ncbi:hypothetical protein [Streptomyces sp. NPDC088775]|uniref:hypothetical protein n=1 Tax=Streptomyces sp. NPDC088775 TaxID=3365896 RepID=UPI0037F357AC
MTNPGQSTPWGKIPIPSEGKTPDVPVDLAAVVDPLDTLLKNLIGGATAPSGPLSPTLIEASASIGSLNATQSAQQAAITTMQGQISGLTAAPWAAATYRPTGFTITGNITTATELLSFQVPSFAQKRLLLAFSAVSMGWTDNATTAALRSRLQIKADGGTTFVDRTHSIASGVDQTMTCAIVETIDAGKSVLLRVTAEVYGTANFSRSAQTQSVAPRIYAVALPWTGPSVPNVPL